ncbi:MAG: hypothetical protein KJP03_07740 [Gammaproteobacteria bacterium]|nr:hypothetical protein [Gammaproteobacteria bacterium]
MSRSSKLLVWELSCVLWICVAGSLLHFAFELSDYWKPMALFAAVNESVWGHLKMYFWPGLFFALAQYTYTRHLANNYWLGKMVALAVTPVVITFMYHGYMSYTAASGSKISVGSILMIMFLGVLAGQLCSWRILSSKPTTAIEPRYVASGYFGLVASFSLFTYFPPQVFLFENYLCYEYTSEYGILDDYKPYRMFRTAEEIEAGGDSIWYCANRSDDATTAALSTS